MVTLLIVLGVIAVLAIDGYVLYRVFAARKSADRYGTVAVPGQTSVTLPAGKVKLTYQESYKAPRRGNSIDFGVLMGSASSSPRPMASRSSLPAQASGGWDRPCRRGAGGAER